MVISPQEKLILSALDAVGVAPVADVAEAANLKEHAARYRLDSLLERDLIVPFCSIAPEAIGYSAYCVYFSPEPRSATDLTEGIRRIIGHPYVSWLGELSGSFQYGCTIYARNLEHALSIISELSELLAIPWHRKAFYQRSRIIFWPLKYFGSPDVPSVAIESSGSCQLHAIDELDHQILSLKSSDGFASNAQVARACGTSVSSISYRITQLHQKGIINGAWFVPNWVKLGLIHSQLSLVLKTIDKKLHESLVQFGRASRVCCVAVACAGSWDFELNVLTEDQMALQAFQSDLWREFGHSIESLNILSYTRVIKFTNYPFSDFEMVRR